MPFQGGKFKPAGETKKGKDNSATPAKDKAKPQAMQSKTKQGEEQSQAPEHVNQTHPGQTQPHPGTGVHAFHAHHTGGGKYTSHTHHGDGTVETQQHPDVSQMGQAGDSAFPSQEQESQETMAQNDMSDLAPQNIKGNY